jgi:hypothetical protein
MRADQSYDLFFWHQATVMSMPSRAIYESLRAHQPVEGLSALPIEGIVSKVVESFPSAVRGPHDGRDSLVWRDDNGEDSFDMTWSSLHVRVECRQLALRHVTTVVDIAATFSCPLYDPQSGRRFRLHAP